MFSRGVLRRCVCRVEGWGYGGAVQEDGYYRWDRLYCRGEGL